MAAIFIMDSINANTLTEVTTVPTNKKLIFTDPDTNEGGIITMENLTKQVLQNLTSQQFALNAGNMTIPAALNALNSEKIKQIPVNITINKNVLSAKLSIDDNEFGIVCLTFAVSSAVYASVLINFGSKYSTNVISANGSNSSNFKFDANAKTLTCNVSTSNNDVHDANAILIK